MLAFNLETNAGVAMKNPRIQDGKHRHFAQWVAQEILGRLWQLKGVNNDLVNITQNRLYYEKNLISTPMILMVSTIFFSEQPFGSYRTVPRIR